MILFLRQVKSGPTVGSYKHRSIGAFCEPSASASEAAGTGARQGGCPRAVYSKAGAMAPAKDRPQPSEPAGEHIHGAAVFAHGPTSGGLWAKSKAAGELRTAACGSRQSEAGPSPLPQGGAGRAVLPKVERSERERASNTLQHCLLERSEDRTNTAFPANGGLTGRRWNLGKMKGEPYKGRLPLADLPRILRGMEDVRDDDRVIGDLVNDLVAPFRYRTVFLGLVL